MSSGNNCDRGQVRRAEWLASPWTPDGKNIYALVHNEYQGQLFTGGAAVRGESQTDAQVLVQLDHERRLDRTPAPPSRRRRRPTHLVATIPYQFAKDGPNGYFTPSNIVRSGDGYFYVDVPRPADKGLQQMGACLMRTRDLSDPTSWRAWNGTAFTVQFQNPYRRTVRPCRSTCARRSTSCSIGTITESLTYNTYFRKWMLVGNSVGDAAHNKPPGFYYSLSDDLLQLDQRDAADGRPRSRWSKDCDPPDPIKDPSLLDPTSTSRNFETVGQHRAAVLHLVPPERLQRHPRPRPASGSRSSSPTSSPAAPPPR